MNDGLGVIKWYLLPGIIAPQLAVRKWALAGNEGYVLRKCSWYVSVARNYHSWVESQIK